MIWRPTGRKPTTFRQSIRKWSNGSAMRGTVGRNEARFREARSVDPSHTGGFLMIIQAKIVSVMTNALIAVIVLLLACVTANGRTPRGNSRSGKKPNLLFIVTDQQRVDTLKAYGNSKIRTPNLDR